MLNEVDEERKRKFSGNGNKIQENIQTIPIEPISTQTKSSILTISIFLSSVKSIIGSVKDSINKEPDEAKRQVLKANAEAINAIIQEMQLLSNNPGT